MAQRFDRRPSPILALCVVAWCGCGETGRASDATEVPHVAAAGSPAGASGAGPGSGGALASAGTEAGGRPGAGRGGAAGVNAGGDSAGGRGSRAGLQLAYVGSSNGQISIYKVGPALGQLSLLKSIDAGNYPACLAFDPSLSHLYAVNQLDGKVAAFKVDPKNGDLVLLNRVDSGGGAPAFVSVDRTGKYVMVANDTGGTTRIFPTALDGSLGDPSDSKSPGMGSHMILTDPNNKFVFVVNGGSDTISQYAFDAATGTLTPNSVPWVPVPVGSGPGRLAFHPSGKFAYLIAELGGTLTAYSYDGALGQLSAIGPPIATLPAGVAGGSNRGAELGVAPSGNFVYGSNLGDDSIATFAVEAATGKLTLIGTTPSGGNLPRSFSLNLDGSLMLVANESGNVTTFAIDVESGSLTKLRSLDVPQKPKFVGIINLPGAAP